MCNTTPSQLFVYFLSTSIVLVGRAPKQTSFQSSDTGRLNLNQLCSWLSDKILQIYRVICSLDFQRTKLLVLRLVHVKPRPLLYSGVQRCQQPHTNILPACAMLCSNLLYQFNKCFCIKTKQLGQINKSQIIMGSFHWLNTQANHSNTSDII